MRNHPHADVADQVVEMALQRRCIHYDAILGPRLPRGYRGAYPVETTGRLRPKSLPMSAVSFPNIGRNVHQPPQGPRWRLWARLRPPIRVRTSDFA